MPEPSGPHPGDGGRRRARAAALPAADRRAAILAAVVPLLAQGGGDVSTRAIADAAGVAEGTIFRVFPDKRALLLAAARQAVDPAVTCALIDDACAGTSSLREQIERVTRRLQKRIRLTNSVLAATQPHLARPAEDAHESGQERLGPPEFLMQAHRLLHRRLTQLFHAHRAELRVSPQQAALALQSLILGSARPAMEGGTALRCEQIADLVLDGVHKKEH